MSGSPVCDRVILFLRGNALTNMTQKCKACRAKGVYFTAKVPYRDRSRVQDIQPPRKNQDGTPRTIIDQGAVRLIGARGACWQAPMSRSSTDAHDAPGDAEPESKTIQFTSPQNDPTTAVIGAGFFAH